MTVNTKAKPLTEPEAIAQVHEWIAAGLPSGTVHAFESGRIVYLAVDDREAVDMWAAALAAMPRRLDTYNGMTYGTGDVKPVALQGWRFDVYCLLPGGAMEPPFRIEVA